MPAFEIASQNQVPKYTQVVNAVTDAIRKGHLKKGQKISSINELSDAYFISRVTVEKAYNILKEQGTIIPIKGKGFYINRVDLDAPVRILLLFNKISNYKKQIYNAFIKTMGTNAIVDLKIHHFNVQILRSLVENNLDDYDYIVLMPYFYENIEEAVNIIKTIPANKLMIIDRRIPFFNSECGCVYQDFENDIIDALDEGLDLLKKYSKLYFVHSNMVPYPPEMARGFRKFCMQNSFKNELMGEVNANTEVKKGDAFIVIEETDLSSLIKNCRTKGLKIGKDVGIISYNETPLKEVLLDGITVISTDHEQLGESAANLILSNSKEYIKNPFVFIRRNSL
ncbi:MAG: GntR family transcriptional regulator [Chitinophagaceae bacterium]|nr:GntR family transcriptional regulator [Chitinophagaceae bacterium]